MSQQFTIEEIYNEETVKKYLRKKQGRNERYLDNVIITLKDFCNFTGKSPTEIYETHRQDLRNHAEEFDMWLNDALDEYVAYLIDNKKGKYTIENYLTRIKSFLRAFKLKRMPDTDIPIDYIEEDFKYALDLNDIQKAIQHCSITYKTYIITQAQTGLSVSDVILLDVQDFVSAVSKKDEHLTVQQAIYRAKTDNIIGCFDLRRKKTKQQFYTFGGPETLRNIAFLLEDREEEFLQPDMPIFIKEIYRLNQEEKLKEKNPENLRLSDKAVLNYFQRLNHDKKIFERIEVDGKERNYFTTHKLRKWFANQLKNEASIGRDDVKFLMGQKTGDVIERYTNPNDYTNLKNNYRKALPHLAITEEVTLEENLEAVEKLQSEVANLKEQNRLQEEKHKREIAELMVTIQKDTKELVYELINKSINVSGEMSEKDLPSGKQALDNLGSAIIEARKDE
ncbi:MAG: hypothetical protein ABFC34_13510 [Methanobacterium sp.]